MSDFEVTSCRFAAAEVSGRIFLAALDNTTEAMVLLDAEGRITYANPAMVALSGHAAPELLGRGVRSTGITPRRLRVYREIVTALKTQSEWRGEYESSARNGEPRRLEVSVTRVDTADPRMRFVVAARDVTHQRRLEYIAEATNLVENMGYVFASLRHELANPINSIKTALTVLRQNHAHLTLDRIDDYLDRVLQETGRVEYLLRSMRSFNTMNRPALEPVPLGSFLDRFTAMVQKDVRGRGVALEVIKDERAGAVLADPQALHQVMLNLITNALDALGDGTSPRIRVEARRGVSHVRIMVSDNGRGVPAEMRDRIFQPFHTTKPRGTGLGLTITRKLVTLMRGTIELSGAEGSGAKFTITLDAADAPEQDRRTPTLWPPVMTGDAHSRGDR